MITRLPLTRYQSQILQYKMNSCGFSTIDLATDAKNVHAEYLKSRSYPRVNLYIFASERHVIQRHRNVFGTRTPYYCHMQCSPPCILYDASNSAVATPAARSLHHIDNLAPDILHNIRDVTNSVAMRKEIPTASAVAVVVEP